MTQEQKKQNQHDYYHTFWGITSIMLITNLFLQKKTWRGANEYTQQCYVEHAILTLSQMDHIQVKCLSALAFLAHIQRYFYVGNFSFLS